MANLNVALALLPPEEPIQQAKSQAAGSNPPQSQDFPSFYLENLGSQSIIRSIFMGVSAKLRQTASR